MAQCNTRRTKRGDFSVRQLNPKIRSTTNYKVLILIFWITCFKYCLWFIIKSGVRKKTVTNQTRAEPLISTSSHNDADLIFLPSFFFFITLHLCWEQLKTYMSNCFPAFFITISTSLLHIVHVVLMSCHFECHAFMDKNLKEKKEQKSPWIWAVYLKSTVFTLSSTIHRKNKAPWGQIWNNSAHTDVQFIYSFMIWFSCCELRGSTTKGPPCKSLSLKKRQVALILLLML